jgi:hypothetical protein
MNKTNTITIAVTIVAVLFLVMPVLDVIATTAVDNRQNNGAGHSERHGTPESNIDIDPETRESNVKPGPDDQGEANCFGKVSAELANSGQTGQHASSFGTPRAGVGNQAEGHPSDHADFIGPIAGSQEGCTQQ